MSSLNKSLYKDLTVRLEELEASDYEENEDLEPASSEELFFTDIQGETKVRLYRDEKFKAFIKGYLKTKHNIQKEKITNKYSEKVYRNMYNKNVAPNKKVYLFTKVLYHPDVTEPDYTYIRNKMDNFQKYVLYNQIGFFIITGLAFYRTSFGGLIRSKPAAGATLLGVSPMLVLLGTQRINEYLLNRRIRLIGLDKKYGIRDK